MGLAVETLNISLEKRYVGFNIVKEIDGTNTGTIQVSIGYYDVEHGCNLLSVKESYIQLSSDNLSMLFSMKAGQLGLTDPRLIQSIDTVIYGIISKAILTTAKLSVTIANAAGEALSGEVILKRKGVVMTKFYATGSLVIDVDTVLGASLEINIPGYLPYVKAYPILNGTVALAVVLEAIPVETPAPTPA